MPTAKNSRVPAHVGALDPQRITRFGRRAIGEELGRASQRMDEAYRRLVAAGGVTSQDLSTIYCDVPDQDEGDHDGEY
jgi:hypothetical protein